MENFMRKEKTLNLEPERSFMVILECNLKKLLRCFKQPPRISQNEKFHAKRRTSDFGPKTQFLCTFSMEYENVVSIFDQPTRICQNTKIHAKRRICKFLTKSGTFQTKFKHTTVIFEMSTMKFLKCKSLINSANFDIGSDSPKDSGSTLSEDLDPSTGPLYEVWHMLTKRKFCRS